MWSGEEAGFPELLNRRRTLHVSEGEKAIPPFPKYLDFACRVHGSDKIIFIKSMHRPAYTQENQSILIFSIYTILQTGLSFPRAIVE